MHQTYLRIMLGLTVNVMDSNACTLISEHFDGGWAYGGTLFDVTI